MEKLLNFKGQWREYQQRVLDDLNFHLTDNKLHIVAAPGAGKTTLGIEVIARLNRPTIILTPTITIRNQWKKRIIEAFLQEPNEDIVSTNIREPKFITVITYQALLAAFCGKNEDEEVQSEEKEDETEISSKLTRLDTNKAKSIINTIKAANIDILCFDEAHHLRKEWWKALNYLTDELAPKQTLSLTATPPYDVDLKEWERYENLCGPIDEIISIPELVKNGDLCPHQDFVHFSRLRQNEDKEIKERLEKISKFTQNLINNKELCNIVQKIIKSSTVEKILETPNEFISLASYLKASKEELDPEFLEIFGIKTIEIPRFSLHYKKLFLDIILLKSEESFKQLNQEDLYKKLCKEAKDIGIILNKCIYLNDNPQIKRKLANSIGKLDSIKQIVDLELNALAKDLRMVILADYIKYDNVTCSELGVYPIWHSLKDIQDTSVCILTGSIIVINKNIQPEAEQLVKEMDLSEYISFKEFERDSNYLVVTSKGSKKSTVVDFITTLFIKGYINIMVGTQALLGEGWDAPCINSLILSSTVTSYMLSNQMRGRAIRIDKNNPNKISNIWHLASISIPTDLDAIKDSCSKTTTVVEELVQISDYFHLKNRFEGFQAPGFEEPHTIESGIERILPNKFYNIDTVTEKEFLALNQTMMQKAQNRLQTKEHWENGLYQTYDAPTKSLKEGIITNNNFATILYKGGLLSILLQYIIITAIILPTIIRFFPQNALSIIAIYAIGFCIACIKPICKYLRCSSPEKIIREIGRVVVESLYAQGLIKTSIHNIRLESTVNPQNKEIFFSIKNLSQEENNFVIKSILEILNPIENPRYILIRYDSNFLHMKTVDYCSVPTLIGQNKNDVLVFQKLWNKYIGKADILYTRTIEGRKALLKARKDAYSDLIRTSQSKKMSRFE